MKYNMTTYLMKAKCQSQVCQTVAFFELNTEMQTRITLFSSRRKTRITKIFIQWKEGEFWYTLNASFTFT